VLTTAILDRLLHRSHVLKVWISVVLVPSASVCGISMVRRAV
jgi:hypothetical protein